MEKTKITIIGAGVCGLAISYLLSQKYRDIFVVERHSSFGQETSSRNSEVIHAGIYYPPNSLKALLCVRGKHLLYDLCQKNNIPHQKIGKFIVSCNDEETKTIHTIYQNAQNNNIANLSFFSERALKKIEPDINVQEALFCPDTGIVDSHQLMSFLHYTSKSQGVNFAFGVEVINVKKESDVFTITVKEPALDQFSFQSEIVINAAGLQAHQIAQLAGIDIKKNRYCIHYNKGQYFRLKNPKKFSIHHLIYPPPSKTDLGIHITPDLAGGVRLGPDARYVKEIDYQINEKDKQTFLKSISRFLPRLELDDLVEDTVGIRAKLQSPQEDFRDFVIADEEKNNLRNFINLLGIESPGLTSCLAIAEKVQDLL